MRLSRVRVRSDAIDPQELHSFVASPSTGATVVFVGTVRDHSEDRTGVTHLEYEVYQDQVERVVSEIVDEAAARWAVEAVAVDHRTGSVLLGEPSVVVAVSAAHRDAAFEAARFVIDELKHRAPIWKKEHWPGGAEWSQGS